jgi:nitrate/TMAO reductase-like tetraheme cytochrome c subunit
VKRFAAALLALIGVVMITACRQYLPSNRYLQKRQPSQTVQSTKDARDKFNHARHTKALAEAGVSCPDCHHFNVLIDTSNEQLARDLATHALYPGSAPCHYCHVSDETRVSRAPQACTTCHENLQPLMPENHQIAWLTVHSSAAQTNPQQCANCHRDAFCINCHERRDTIQTVVHTRNFRFYHSIEARANPRQCGSCHREDFCTNCHQQNNVGPD